MAQVGFYHLTRTTPDQALPELLGRTLAAGQRAVVQAGSAARVAALDKALWAAERPDWLPHGTARTGHAAWQPIWITPEPECPNGARFLFLLDGAAAPLKDWDRVFDLFDGHDTEAVAAARQRWTAAKADGHALTYWRQTAAGWEKA
jgi:DNA polymerase-3 subunit chi